MSNKQQDDRKAKSVEIDPFEERHEQSDANEHEEGSEENLEALEHPSYEALEAKLTESEAKANQYWNQFLRAQADLDNVRRRTERDISSAHKYGSEKLISELLLVVDSLERGLEIGGSEAAKALHDGMVMTLNMLLKTLEKFGVKQLNPLDEAFNPEWHQAVSMIEEPGAKANTVLKVLQKGYLLHDRLLRPAIVVVAKG